MDYVQKQYRRGDASSHVLSTVGMNIIVADHKLVYGTRYVDPPNCGSSGEHIGQELGSAFLCGTIIPVHEVGRYAVIVHLLYADELRHGQPIYRAEKCLEPMTSEAMRTFDDTIRTTLNENDYLVGTITVTNSLAMYAPIS